MARYITTTLPYVNADPHIGFAHEIIQADVLARAWRLSGEEVFFNTGTDEHGQKLAQSAEKAGQTPQEYADRYAAEFEKLKSALAITNDAFIRTTDPRHMEAAQEMWKRCDAAGDIYKKSYSGLYCVGCEAFKTEHELTEDKHCELHPNLVPQEVTEENYFFRLSKYQGALEEYLSRIEVVIPEWRREEALNFVRSGLEDFSISREASKLSWGIPVPGDESQVMYVWFDALTSYISTLGWPSNQAAFETFWEKGHTLQLAGKDQVRFQSIMWQAMLMSAKIKNTDQVFYQGFINSGGQKMSKSLGNVINPYELVEKYGTEATRYLLLRHVHPVEDSDITWERLDEWYTANLVNGLGNLVARVMKLAETHLDAPVPITKDDVRIEEGFMDHFYAFQFQAGMDLLFEHVTRGDEFMTSREPYKKIKDPETETEARAEIMQLVKHVAKVAAHLESVMPETSAAILIAVSENKKPENLFPRLG
ncbi:MAG TPA: methionine--tRNA ligase [Candidatus Paceibacterota bacterium]|jgi:methionyl-tRNA synthetase|nr:methionine--tRNA ligase [Candidatus Paceibacterota bacterium]